MNRNLFKVWLHMFGRAMTSGYWFSINIENISTDFCLITILCSRRNFRNCLLPGGWKTNGVRGTRKQNQIIFILASAMYLINRNCDSVLFVEVSRTYLQASRSWQRQQFPFFKLNIYNEGSFWLYNVLLSFSATNYRPPIRAADSSYSRNGTTWGMFSQVPLILLVCVLNTDKLRKS